MTDAIPYMPIIVGATKFLFGEASKWLDSARKRIGKGDAQPAKPSPGGDRRLSAAKFFTVENDPTALSQLINRQRAESNAYAIRGLLDQLKIHHKNLVDHETTESEFGSLVPQHVKRAIERESSAVVEKSDRLRELLEDVYGGTLEHV